MNEFKIGDVVRVKRVEYGGLSNKIGKIIDIRAFTGMRGEQPYCILDIDITSSGVWLKDLELVDKKLNLKRIKQYGIVKFMESKHV